MAFKDISPELKFIDIAQIEPDPKHPRKHYDDAGLKALAKSIQSKGLIHPLVVQPADAQGKHRLIVGERRWRAAQLAGERTLPALVRACATEECLEIQVFENIGLGVRTALEPREMANAIQTITQRFETQEAAAEHFGRTPQWLNQATAAAKLSPKVTALLDTGKLSSTSTALQIERLAQKDEAQAETLIERIEQLPEGEKLPKAVVETALVRAGAKRATKKVEEIGAVELPVAAAPAPAPARRVNPGKIRMVAEILGLSDGDEEEVLARLIDEFLAMKTETTPAF